MTNRIANVNDSFNETAFHPLISRIDTNSIRTSFPIGITVVISIAATIPNFVIRLPQNFSDATSGLLGNFNGDPDDDFMSPINGIVTSSDATDREIHSYAQLCNICVHVVNYIRLVSLLHIIPIQGKYLMLRASSPTHLECQLSIFPNLPTDQCTWMKWSWMSWPTMPTLPPPATIILSASSITPRQTT